MGWCCSFYLSLIINGYFCGFGLIFWFGIKKLTFMRVFVEIEIHILAMVMGWCCSFYLSSLTAVFGIKLDWKSSFLIYIYIYIYIYIFGLIFLRFGGLKNLAFIWICLKL